MPSSFRSQLEASKSKSSFRRSVEQHAEKAPKSDATRSHVASLDAMPSPTTWRPDRGLPERIKQYGESLADAGATFSQNKLINKLVSDFLSNKGF